MKSYNLIKKLERYTLFTENDLAKLTGKGQKYIRTLLYRLAKKGVIKRIEKGKYTLYDDAMIFASHIITPSYLGLWTGLRYYNLTQQQPLSLFVLSPVSKNRIKFQDTEIIFIKTKHLFGYKKERYSDFDIFISDKEKTIIDGFLFHIPTEDLISALDNKEIDLKRLTDYATKTKNASLIKRLGYLLEKSLGNSYRLKAMDNNYVRLYPLRRKKGKKNRKWKLIINAG